MAISLTCDQCEHSLKVKDELAGKEVKCPECGELIRVPSDKVTATRPAAKTSTAVTEEEPRRKAKRDEEEEPEERPKKKKKKKRKSNNTLWLMIAGGVAVVGVAVLLFVFVFSKPADAKKENEPGDDKQAGTTLPPREKKGSGGLYRLFERTEVQNYLKQLHVAHELCLDANKGQGPSGQADLAKHYGNNSQINELLAKQVTFIYKVSRAQVQARPEAILAHEHIPDQNGARMVLRCNGKIEPLGEQPFRAAQKAGP